MDVKEIPIDTNAMKEMIIELRRQLNLEELKYEQLEEKYKVLQQRFFGRSSEKISDTELGQQVLFNEAEDGCTLGKVIEEDNVNNIITGTEGTGQTTW